MWKRWWGRPAGTSYTISSTNSIWAHYWDNVFSISIVTVFYINTQCPFDLRLFLRAWPHTSQDFFETSRQAGNIWPQHRELRALLLSNSAWVLLRPAELLTMKSSDTGPTVYRRYPRRIDSLTICRCNYKGSTYFLLSYLKTPIVSPAKVGCSWRFEDVGRHLQIQRKCLFLKVRWISITHTGMMMRDWW